MQTQSPGKPKTQTERTPAGPEPHPPPPAQHARHRTAEGVLKRPPRPHPTRRRVSGVSLVRRHDTEARSPSPTRGSAGPKTLAGRGGRAPNVPAGVQASPGRPTPRPQASASTRQRPRPSEALRSASPGSLPCVGLGAGRQEGVGTATAAAAKGKKKISAATTGRLDLKQNLLGDEGEGKKAGDWKEEKTEAGNMELEEQIK
ncbi:translation initiation factor IF-2-like isoform X2 [Herpailurus yagouaroundi]|uniref:translation initiation factor IF-2-like isoform X2 n=1 Tax=Herpailurus yagouaroundi TaxID=1608482 RepID=UPI001AD72F38|nr:translation initiation factor IF-2-like isoform X2 [Puma yagouaroundi]